MREAHIASAGLCLTLVVANSIVSTTASGQSSEPQIIKEKQTTPGLYVTSKEAYEKWQADTAKIKILDVRTPEEYIYIGHATIAINIPIAFQTYDWDSTKNHFAMKPNADFVNQVKSIAKPQDTLLVMCRSGGRSAIAVNALAAAGFKNVYNITDGMEGDAVKDSESVFAGQRMVNGWKNSGCPWTYEIDKKLILIPETK